MHLIRVSVDENKIMWHSFAGEVGSWKTELSPKLAAFVDKWTEEKITNVIGLKFA